MDPKIERLQNHLALIRTCAGWSADVLGKKLGVSRQMINNLEHHRNAMTKMQYLAILQVLDEEIRCSKEDEVSMLKDVIKVLVDEPEKYTEEERNKVLSDANLLAPAILAKKTSRENASLAWKASLAGAIIAGVAATAVAVVAISKNKK